MQKKKSNNDFLVISVIALLFALFLGLNLGFAMYDVELLEQKQGQVLDGAEKYSVIGNFFEDEMKKVTIKDFRWNDTVKKPVYVAAFIWFLVVAYYSSSRKNLITGKEYGTARWGTQNDISDLFAENIKNKEISRAKRMRFFWSRMAVKKEIKRYCKKYADEQKNQEIENVRNEYKRMIKLLEDDND